MTDYQSAAHPDRTTTAELPALVRRPIRITRGDLMVEATARFGGDYLDIAFVCPSCGDVATLREWQALSGDTKDAGTQCVGRTPAYARIAAGMPATRGCGTVAYGLICGPWEVLLEDGRSMWGFALAGDPAPGGPVEKASV
jgi:hypothetical protein